MGSQMETTKSSLLPSDSDLYNSTDELKTSNASNPNSMDKTGVYPAFLNGGQVYIFIITIIEVPMICLAISAVFTLIKSNQSTSVFVINLLTADLIQIVGLLLLTIPSKWTSAISYGTTIWIDYTRCYFMTCIAVERYIMIAHPVWHRTHRSVKCLVCTSLTGWLLPLALVPVNMIHPIEYIMPFIPFVVIIVCFALVCRSLSRSISLTPLKKQLVLAPLFFVLMSYTFLTLSPTIFPLLLHWSKSLRSLVTFVDSLYLLNPLVDSLLYVFMRSDAENIIRMPWCCCSSKRSQSKTQSTVITDDGQTDSHQTA